MKVGDLVMWLGKDDDHGSIGIISKVFGKYKHHYSVVWSDLTVGHRLFEEELQAVEDEDWRQSET